MWLGLRRSRTPSDSIAERLIDRAEDTSPIRGSGAWLPVPEAEGFVNQRVLAQIFIINMKLAP